MSEPKSYTTAGQRRVEATEDIICGPQAVSSEDIQINEADDTIRMFGVLYSLSLFRDLGINGMAVGAHLKIVGRSDGAVHLQRLYTDEPEARLAIATEALRKIVAGHPQPCGLANVTLKELTHAE